MMEAGRNLDANLICAQETAFPLKEVMSERETARCIYLAPWSWDRYANPIHYEAVKGALTGEGIAVTQCESIYLHRNVIEGVFSFARGLFPKLGYYYTLVPTYPSGLIGFFFCSLARDPLQDLDEGRATGLQGLRYYTPDIHRAAFSLPLFATRYFRP